MAKTDQISGFFWLIFSIFMSYHSYQLGLGTLRQPGPGFLFFWTGVFVAILSIGVIGRSFGQRTSKKPRQPIFRTRHGIKILSVLLSILIYGLLLEWLGFPIVTMLFFMVLLGLIERKPWSFAVGVSSIVTAVSYFLFEIFLRSHLPRGLLDFF